MNQPPVACAGADHTIALPNNTVTLDGSCSTDPENDITAYLWTKIAGPAAFSIARANASQTNVTGLQGGVYLFELKVTDVGGLFSKDTVQLIVLAAQQAIACDGTRRSQIAARLIPVGTLAIPRDGITIGAAGTKIVFAGGVPDGIPTNAVDIYDTVTHQWTTAKLSQPRIAMAAVSSGEKLLFAGGNWSEGDFAGRYDNIDVYDAATNSWSVRPLTEARGGIAAAAIGSKVFFAGGGALDYYYTSTSFCACIPLSDKVDIYDLSTGAWSRATLSEARYNSAAVVVGNKIYFAGGIKDSGSGAPSDRIDIYDNTTQTWSTASLTRPMRWIAGAAVDDKIVWADECNVEIRKVATGVSASAALSHRGQWYADFGLNAVTKDKNIVFFHHRLEGSDGTFDIYNAATDAWLVGVLPEKIAVNAVISVNNTIYLVGGVSETDYKNKVWKLEF